jgi:hypothetical protein
MPPPAAAATTLDLQQPDLPYSDDRVAPVRRLRPAFRGRSLPAAAPERRLPIGLPHPWARRPRSQAAGRVTGGSVAGRGRCVPPTSAGDLRGRHPWGTGSQGPGSGMDLIGRPRAIPVTNRADPGNERQLSRTPAPHGVDPPAAAMEPTVTPGQRPRSGGCGPIPPVREACPEPAAAAICHPAQAGVLGVPLRPSRARTGNHNER